MHQHFFVHGIAVGNPFHLRMDSLPTCQFALCAIGWQSSLGTWVQQCHCSWNSTDSRTKAESVPAKAASRDLIPFRGSCANLWRHDPVHRATRLEQLFIGVLTARSQWCPCPNSCTAADDVFLIPQKCWRVLHEYHSGPLRGIAAINHINFLNAMLKNHPNRTPANPCSSFDNAQFGLQSYSPLCALVDTGCILQQVNHPPVYAVLSFDWSFHAWWQPCKYCFLHKNHKI